MDGEPLQYGIPLKPGAKHGHGETGIDDAWLVLSTYIVLIKCVYTKRY